jgi:hypothetical protein
MHVVVKHGDLGRAASMLKRMLRKEIGKTLEIRAIAKPSERRRKKRSIAEGRRRRRQARMGNNA